MFLILNSSFPLRQSTVVPYGFIFIITVEQNEQITYEISVNRLKLQKRRDEIKNNFKVSISYISLTESKFLAWKSSQLKTKLDNLPYRLLQVVYIFPKDY